MDGQVRIFITLTKQILRIHRLGSFLEFLPMLSLMKEKYTPKELPYHIIVPSHPGYGFSSSPPLNRDFGMADIATIINQLMLDLGFGSGYIVQGGDIGSRVARILSLECTGCKGKRLSFNFPVESRFNL
jgi:microsomal epoxide hydrolase